VKRRHRHAKRVHQGRLDSAGHFSDPVLTVTASDNVDFGERHGLISFATALQIKNGYSLRPQQNSFFNSIDPLQTNSI
jgi:hypothetical protein